MKIRRPREASGEGRREGKSLTSSSRASMPAWHNCLAQDCLDLPAVFVKKTMRFPRALSNAKALPTPQRGADPTCSTPSMSKTSVSYLSKRSKAVCTSRSTGCPRLAASASAESRETAKRTALCRGKSFLSIVAAALGEGRPPVAQKFKTDDARGDGRSRRRSAAARRPHFTRGHPSAPHSPPQKVSEQRQSCLRT